ncbi:MAG: HDOD domain-containing protein [Desulfatiglans sp.]|jgi:putative nucleotidyltransferase with HDIG domain|nr:HDOD domain-containing protein [Desulfatiglans sp.]
MKVDCPNCHKVYNIPDEKLPVGKKFTIPCPACKWAIKFDLRAKEEPKKKAVGEELKKKILQQLTGVLPPMPQVVVKARQIVSDESSGLKDLATAIASDQAITVRALKLANSAFYGLKQRVTSIGHASVLLGGEVLREIIIMAGTQGLLPDKLKGYELESGALWSHSLAVAIGSRLLAESRYPELSNDAFTAGLIHDVGKVMLDEHVLERKDEIEELLKDGKTSFLKAEKEVFGFDHAEIGSEVINIWGLPKALSSAITYHHDPSNSDEDRLAFLVHLADFIAVTGENDTRIDSILYEMDEKTLEFLDLDEDDIGGITEKVFLYVDNVMKKIGS